MSIFYNPAPTNNLISLTTEQIKHYDEQNTFNILEEESLLYGGVKTKKSKKMIDNYKKTDLEKIAKKHDISLKTKGKIKTKEQLFNSLKRKKLI